MKLYVGNLPPNFTDQDLHDLFSEFGDAVKSAKMILDRETGRSKGFGFVEMDSKDSGMKAIKELDKKVVGKGPIIVNEARPQERKEGGRPSFNKPPRSRY